MGTGICLVIQRDPIITAKQVASVDHLSGGRFLFGVGAGWNLEEMRNHGTDPSKRFGLMRERVEAMKAIWTEDEAEYHGKYVDFDPIWSWPKPVQKPHPPILVGGNGRTVGDRVLAFGDEWYPNRFGDEDKFNARIEKMRSRGRDEAGRDIGVTVQLAPLDPEGIERLEQAGAHRCLWFLPAAGREEVERALDHSPRRRTPTAELWCSKPPISISGSSRSFVSRRNARVQGAAREDEEVRREFEEHRLVTHHEVAALGGLTGAGAPKRARGKPAGDAKKRKEAQVAAREAEARRGDAERAVEEAAADAERAQRKLREAERALAKATKDAEATRARLT